MSRHNSAMDSSPFLKRVLVPFWVIRVLIMVAELAIYGLALVFLATYSDDAQKIQDRYSSDYSFGVLIGIVVVIFVIIFACLLLDIIAIVKRMRHTLTPRLFLVFNVVQTTVWTALLVLSLIGARNGLIIVIAVVIYLSFLGLLIYAAIIFHRHRKGTLVRSHAQEPYSTGAPSSYEPSTAAPRYDTGYGYNGAGVQPQQPQQTGTSYGGYSGGYGEGGQATELKGSTTYYGAPNPHTAA